MKKEDRPPAPAQRTTLRSLGEYLGLSPSTISFVLNGTPGRSIPEATRERVRRAAEELNYQPSMIARTLRGQRMQTVGIMLPELGEGYHSRVVSGIGDMLMQKEYFHFTVQHRHKPKLITTYPYLLQARGIEGILAIDTLLPEQLPLPTVLVAGHTDLPGITNVTLDHELAAKLALEHLFYLGHRKIVFMKGQSFSTDTEFRWLATLKAARELGIKVDKKLCVELTEDSVSPAISYPLMQKLLEQHRDFTAVLSFNDVSAMGAIRALHDANMQVPKDVSVIGFDDIQSSLFHVPSLTTIRQPLQAMGSTAAAALLDKLEGRTVPDIIRVEPELVIRESTGPATTESGR